MPKTCVAVGYSTVPSDAILTERWNGRRWSTMPAADQGVSQPRLNSVACPASTACTAVGTSKGQTYEGLQWRLPLAEQWRAGHWRVAAGIPLQVGTVSADLTAVSCSSTNACTAVGSYYDGVTTRPLIERRNGSTWTIQRWPTTAPDVMLTGVSCSSRTACMTIGYTSNPERPAAGGWNGTRWRIKPPRNPRGALAAEFSGISCASPNACVAVGAFLSHQAAWSDLVERWNGHNWAIQPTP